MVEDIKKTNFKPIHRSSDQTEHIFVFFKQSAYDDLWVLQAKGTDDYN